jgi:hypothetical protein
VESQQIDKNHTRPEGMKLQMKEKKKHTRQEWIKYYERILEAQNCLLELRGAFAAELEEIATMSSSDLACGDPDTDLALKIRAAGDAVSQLWLLMSDQGFDDPPYFRCPCCGGEREAATAAEILNNSIPCP